MFFWIRNSYSSETYLLCKRYHRVNRPFIGTARNNYIAGVFEKLGVRDPYRDLVRLPEEVELAVREKDGKRFAFLLNYAKTAVKVAFLRPVRDLFTGETLEGERELPPFGVTVAEL